MLANKTKASIIFLVVLLLLTSITATSYAYTKYTIKQGDSLFKISRRFNTSLSQLTSLNNINNPNLIYPSQVLSLPDNNYNVTNKPNETESDFKQQQNSFDDKPSKKIFRRGPKIKQVALTFDDGPDTKYTPQILKVLKKYDVQATFFLLGKLAQKNPQVVQQIKEDGHVIGNHSWSHADLTTLNEEELSQELTATTEEIEKIIDQTPILLRPPYGAISDELLTNLTDTNYKLVNWSIDSLDWKAKDEQEIINHTLPNIHQGANILFHSASGPTKDLTPTVKALPVIIEKLREEGYEIVTVDQLYSLPNYS